MIKRIALKKTEIHCSWELIYQEQVVKQELDTKKSHSSPESLFRANERIPERIMGIPITLSYDTKLKK